MIVTVAAGLALQHRARGFSLFSPLTAAAALYLVMFGAVPVADVVFDHPMTHHSGWWAAGCWAWMGAALLFVGHEAAFMPGVRQQRRRPGRSWSPRAASTSAVLMLALATGMVFAWIGPSQVLSYFQNLAAARAGGRKTPTTLLIAVSFAAPAIAIQAANVAAQRTRPMLLLLLAMLPPAVLASAFIGQRWRTVAIAGALVTITHLGYRRFGRPTIALVLAAGVTLFVGFGLKRNFVGTGDSPPPITGENLYYNYVGRSEFAQFRDFVITIEGVPRRLPFQNGQTFLSVIPGAPFPTGGYLQSETFHTAFYAAGTSIPPPLPGELYMNFAVPGVLIGMFLFGVVLGGIERFYRAHASSPAALAIYGYSVVPLALVLRGDFTTFGGYYLVGLAALLAAISVSYLAGSTRRRPIPWRKRPSTPRLLRETA